MQDGPSNENQIVRKSINTLALRCFNHLADIDVNAVISTIGLFTSFDVLVGATRGQSQKEVLTGLTTFSNPSDIHRLTKKLLRCFPHSAKKQKPSDAYKLGLSFKIFVPGENGIEPSFKQYVAESYDVFWYEGLNSDKFKETFSQTCKEWLDEVCHNTISEVAPLCPADCPISVVIVNATYFQLHWKYAFSADCTVSAQFFNFGESKKVVSAPTMVQRVMCGICTMLIAKINCVCLRLALDGDIEMIIIHPSRKKELKTMMSGLTLDTYGKILASFKMKHIKLLLPKFQYDTRYDCWELLQKIGINRILDIKTSDLSGLYTPSEQTENQFLSYLLQYTQISLAEEGIAIKDGKIYAQNDAKIDSTVKLDHPFAYILRESRRDIILVVGKVETV